jgi:hypothetical protein
MVESIAGGNALAARIGTRCWPTKVTEARFTEQALNQYRLAHADLTDTDRRAGFDMTLFRDEQEALSLTRSRPGAIPARDGLSMRRYLA